MTNESVIIAGGGIAGLTLALTLHQIGVPFLLIESSREMRPLGVGINVQPNAVRELCDLGLTADHLDSIGVPVREWALVGLNGKEVYAEQRGLDAGYHWPQYAVHRGKLQALLYKTLVERAGEDCVCLGTRVTGYLRARSKEQGIVASLCHADGTNSELSGKLLIGADGIHSAVRARMHPNQPPIHWGGALMWRGTVRATPLRTESSFVGLGTPMQRVVIYPISRVGADGKALVNWIAEVTMNSSDDWPDDSWFQEVDINSFVHYFDDFRYDWLDVPDMLQAADCAYLNPMIDRDPVDSWVDGPVALIGDAAHAMYPTGSNGASQAIVDARVMGAAMLKHGITTTALTHYNDQLCKKISELILRNRSAGPFGLLTLLDQRCSGVFDDIEAVLPQAERSEFMRQYKAAAGFAVEELNGAPPTIPMGATVSVTAY